MTILTAQERLKAAGFDPGPLDGQWGARCDAALDAALAAIRGVAPPEVLPAASRKLTDLDIEDAAAALRATTAKVRAVAEVESGRAGGFGADGRPIILFEPHVFSRLTGRRFDATHGGVSYPSWGERPYPATQTARWDQLLYAAKLDRAAAYQSASWGLFQILGANFKSCGFGTIDAFAEAMSLTEREHLMAFVQFVISNRIDDDLREGRWADFAAVYNGPAYKKNAYDAKLAAAEKKWVALA